MEQARGWLISMSDGKRQVFTHNPSQNTAYYKL